MSVLQKIWAVCASVLYNKNQHVLVYAIGDRNNTDKGNPQRIKNNLILANRFNFSPTKP